MSRIDSSKRTPPKARVTPAAKPPVPAPAAKAKAEAKEASKGWQPQAKEGRPRSPRVSTPQDNFVDRSALKELATSVRDEIKAFAKAKGATVTANDDGSQTRSSESTRGGTTRTKELTSKQGPFGASELEYEATKKTASSETTRSAQLRTDAFGRRESTVTDTTSATRGNLEKSVAKTSREGALGLSTESKTTTRTTTTEQGQRGTVAEAVADSVTRDSRGNRASSREESRTVTTGGASPGDRETTTTSSSTTTRGQQLETANTLEAQDGKVSVGSSADWTSGKSKDVSWSRESGAAGQQEPPGLQDQQATPTAGDVLREAGVGMTWSKSVGPGNKEPAPESFVGARAGVTGEQSFSVDPTGVSATYNREASAGLYAEKRGSTEGQLGQASYEAQAKLEAKATVDAEGKLDSNGLTASVGAKAGVSAEASISGSASTKPVKVGGVEVSAGVEGTAKVSAEVSAEATGQVQVTRNPPTAIAEGTVGASAVAKAEADVKVSAGPFAVTATGYASAGAEAKATGIIGYQDGKLKLGGSLGAAVGVGLGGSAAVEIDVKQIGELTHVPQAAEAAKKAVTNAADVNNDGKVDGSDAKSAVTAVTSAATSTVNQVKDAAKDTAKGAANKVKGWFGF